MLAHLKPDRCLHIRESAIWRRTTRRSAPGTTHTAVLILDTTLLSHIRRRSDRRILRRVDAHGDPGEDPIPDVLVVQEHVLHKGVDRVGLLRQDAVVRVRREFLRVGAVGRQGLDLADQVLVEEELADVGGSRGVEARDGVVAETDGFVRGVAEDW